MFAMTGGARNLLPLRCPPNDSVRRSGPRSAARDGPSRSRSNSRPASWYREPSQEPMAVAKGIEIDARLGASIKPHGGGQSEFLQDLTQIRCQAIRIGRVHVD